MPSTILIHDFAGHPFQFQLSRELARRGNRVHHVYFADIPGPKGKFEISKLEASNLSVEGISTGIQFARYSYWDRLKVHHRYAQLLEARIRALGPDVVLSGNTPTEVQYRLTRVCARSQVRFVHWIQDLYPLALRTLLNRKYGSLGSVFAAPFQHLERRIFRNSDSVVYISQDFREYAEASKLHPKSSIVIENWACLEEIPLRPKDNAWSRSQGLADRFVFLYSGTLGLKHNPGILLDLARQVRHRPEVRVVVVSEGVGRQILEEGKRKESLKNLILLDFQPYSDLPDVLASADVLLANIEPESSQFSVPSKILTYLCAGRALVISVPAQNLAARLVSQAEAGLICPPDRPEKFFEAANRLISDSSLRLQMAQRAREYAERTFHIGQIADRFESVLYEESMVPMSLTPSLARES